MAAALAAVSYVNVVVTVSVHYAAPVTTVRVAVATAEPVIGVAAQADHSAVVESADAAARAEISYRDVGFDFVSRLLQQNNDFVILSDAASIAFEKNLTDSVTVAESISVSVEPSRLVDQPYLNRVTLN